MNGRYSMETMIESYNAGQIRALKPSSMLRMMQEAAGRHLEQDGLSYGFMRSKGIVFLIVKEAVRVYSLPKCGEETKVETWFARTEKARFKRNFRFLGKKGESKIEAATEWIIADPVTHRIIRPSAFGFDLPEVCNAGVGAKVGRIEVPSTLRPAGLREVRWSDIDYNGHMNNSVYADIVCDFFPGGLGKSGLYSFQINFDGEAGLGDSISIETASLPDGSAVIRGTIEHRRCFLAKASALPEV